ncbi:MAG: cytochrome c3 family protein [Gemmataceae bacterium]
MTGKVWATVGVLTALAAGAWWYTRPRPAPPDTPAPPADTPHVAAVSIDCAECHRREYDTWFRTYHRTMTRDAAPDTVKGDFAGAAYEYAGVVTRATRRGDEFYLETADPGRATRTTEFRVDRVVGSHWIQEYLHRAPNGQYVRLPVLYHLGERRWVHSHGGFLAPESADFWEHSRGAVWNASCLYCHNTGPRKNPLRDALGRPAGFRTEVAELGISCEACHGPGDAHLRKQRGDSIHPADDVVHPGRLPVARRDEVCGRCHGALVPKPEAWDRLTHRDPFVPGRPLEVFNHVFRSEGEQAALAAGRPKAKERPTPDPTDGRFWGDGTPLTTALEFNGLQLSACYENGTGRLSCMTCHAMHGDEPNMLVRPTARGNDACLSCHPAYRDKLTEHTRHAADGPGSLCYSCHMPHQVYSLMTTHRSHRIQTPELADSVGTGKPHACNLCHLDKSLGWTKAELAKWPGPAAKRAAAAKLDTDDEAHPAAVLALLRGDARTRAVVAGAFSHAAAKRAGGTDWHGAVLTRLLEEERYPVVRYLMGRALPDPFDALASPAERRARLLELRGKYGTPAKPTAAEWARLRAGRNDPDVTVNE